MMPSPLDRPTETPILVSDFDGTLTQHDFYQLVMDRRLAPGTPNYWQRYVDGEITHFDALRFTFEAAEPGEDELVELTLQMELEADLARELEALREAGWEVVVVSAGSIWYIDRLLREAGVTLEVHTNRGRIEGGRLLMERPADSPFLSHQTGIDKAAVVRAALEGGRTVAFAGDGRPDLEPALLVPPDRRYAHRGKDLAEALLARGESFHPFDRWAEVAQSLREGAPS
jgi:2,3-diketo-5-methylthio-1-phosphopentane phosphatase